MAARSASSAGGSAGGRSPRGTSPSNTIETSACTSTMKSYVGPVLLRKLSWRPAPFASMAGTVRLLVLNGKGLDTRGSTEESRTYFRSSAQLSDYDAHIRATASELGVAVEHLQTNDLDECIRLLSGTDADAIVINPAGFGKEPALVECIAALRKPVFEVHYGNFFAKGATSLVTAACNGLICGAKLSSYSAGMRAAVEALKPSPFDHPPPEK
ncbi:aroQ [Symbiodinium sp. KB8]|nr:aroQ [Symbiodinium sp. KB8]